MWRTELFLLALLIIYVRTCLCGDSSDAGTDLPGHMQPLGSHKPPILVQRIQHLPTPAEFYKTYVQPKVPVVMEGALDEATIWRKWQNDDYLR